MSQDHWAHRSTTPLFVGLIKEMARMAVGLIRPI
jgi:hypothetical protein